MPKDNVCISESEIDGEEVETLIRESIKNMQGGLCEVESHLLRMIDADEIDAPMWLASNMVQIELKNLVNELIAICRELKPSGKALKVARGDIDNGIKQFEQSGENI